MQGAPATDLLRNLNATVTSCHSKTDNLPEIVRQADIIVVAIRQPCYVKKDWVSPGTVVIDAGINAIPGDLLGYPGLQWLCQVIVNVHIYTSSPNKINSNILSFVKINTIGLTCSGVGRGARGAGASPPNISEVGAQPPQSLGNSLHGTLNYSHDYTGHKKFF